MGREAVGLAAGAAIPVVGVGRRGRSALRALQITAPAIVLAVVTYRDFDLDRFFVPKELALHLSAFAAALILLRELRRLAWTRLDLLLIAFLGISLFSAFFATNPWLALRAVAMSASGITLFWAVRALRESVPPRAILIAVAGAVVLSSTTSLLQAYGLETEIFTTSRSPGGTLGNRNFIAHVAAFGFPIVLLTAIRAWRSGGYLIGAIGVAIATGSLVLTRSRAGWLALGVAVFVLVVSMLVSRPLRRDRRTWARLIGILLLVGGAVVVVVYLPNQLEWRSANPYLESVQGLTNYQEGSGRGRLVQYGRSLRMAASHPLLGVGPGNWPVHYFEYAGEGDPSLDASAPGMTSNPWPSSDWVSYLTERGIPAVLMLGLALGSMALRAIRTMVRARDADEATRAAALLATLLAVGVAGAFDAVLLLALPTFLFWVSAGALWDAESSLKLKVPARIRSVTVGLLLLTCGIGVFRSASQLVAMGVYANRDDTSSLRRAAALDPGNYRLQVRLAGRGGGAGREIRCEHAIAARNLFPTARTARNLAEGCGE